MVVASISRESIRQTLRADGITWQATKTWKASNDPDFIAKMRRAGSFTMIRPPTGGWYAPMSSPPLNLQPRPRPRLAADRPPGTAAVNDRCPWGGEATRR